MKLIKDYENYMEDILLESIDEVVFKISPELKKVLNIINHPISKMLLSDATYEITNKITYIDMVPNEYDKWSFVISSKLISSIVKDLIPDDVKDENEKIGLIRILVRSHGNDISKKIKSKIKIARLIQKIYPNKFLLNGKPGEDIESFVLEYKSLFESDEENTKIVQGDDIIKWYNSLNYINGDGPLQNSCMSHNKCSDYLKFYAINPEKVRMVILLDPTNLTKIRSRSLLWKIDEINGEKVTDKYFMDRIYYSTEKDLLKMINFAKNNKFYYKKAQSTVDETIFIDPINNNVVDLIFTINDIDYDKNLLFPFLDTVYYYNPYDKILTNNKNVDKKTFTDLSSTNGKTNIFYSKRYKEILIKNKENVVYSKYEDDILKIDDSVKVYDQYGNIDYLPINGDGYVHSEYTNENHFKKDCQYLENYNMYVPNRILDLDFVYSDFFDKWIKKYESVYSDYMESWIPKEDAIKIYTDEIASNYYYTIIDDPHEDFYKFDNKYYSNDVKKSDIEKYKHLSNSDE